MNIPINLILALIIAFSILGIWIWGFIDCLVSKKDTKEKLLWIIVIIFFNFLGSLAYLIAAKDRTKSKTIILSILGLFLVLSFAALIIGSFTARDDYISKQRVAREIHQTPIKEIRILREDEDPKNMQEKIEATIIDSYNFQQYNGSNLMQTHMQKLESCQDKAKIRINSNEECYRYNYTFQTDAMGIFNVYALVTDSEIIKIGFKK